MNRGSTWRARAALVGGPLLALTLAGCGAPRSHQAFSLPLKTVLQVKPHNAQVSAVQGLPPKLGVIAFADAMHGWLGGQGVLLTTFDGGRTWRTSYQGKATIEGFSMLSAQQGFAATNLGLLTTTNGSDWQFVNPTPLQSVQFFSPQVGVALRPDGTFPPAGQNGATPTAFRILWTADGGRAWQAEMGPPVLAACFFGPQQGAAALYSANGLSLAYTADGGHTWSSATSVSGGYGATLTCTPDGGAWLVAVGGIGMSQASYSVLRSGNFGRTWAPVLARPTAGGGSAPGNPTGIAAGPGLAPGPLVATDKEHAVMLGDTCLGCGTVLLDSTSDGGRTWQLGSSTIPYATPVNLTLSMPSPGLLWLMSAPMTLIGASPGMPSQVEVSADGGHTWREAQRFGPETPYVMQLASKLSGYGVGWSGDAREVLVTKDGGTSWQAVGRLPQGLAPAAGYDSLAAPRDGVLYLVATYESNNQPQSLYASRNSGRTWRAVQLPSEGYGVSSVSFATPSLGCAAVNTGGSLRDYATRDGGATWHAASGQGTPAAVCATDLADPQLGRLARELIQFNIRDYLLATADGGGDSLWLTFVSDNSSSLRIYLLGPSGHTVQVWNWPQSAPGIAGIDPVTANLAYIWSGDGQLLRTNDGGRQWQQVTGGSRNGVARSQSPVRRLRSTLCTADRANCAADGGPKRGTNSPLSVFFAYAANAFVGLEEIP